MTQELTPEALDDLPIFPLPGAVLIPRTFMSFHIFEPRYRRMMEDVIEGPRVMAIAMLDESGGPDMYERPPIHRIGGLGVLRRSARLPDGRFNIVLEGMARVDLGLEYPPTRVYRRARGRLLTDQAPEDPGPVKRALASLRALAVRAFAAMDGDPEVLESLGEVTDPGHLADLIAAAILSEAIDRQRVLAELRVDERVSLVAGALGAMILHEAPKAAKEAGGGGWGIKPGEA